MFTEETARLTSCSPRVPRKHMTSLALDRSDRGPGRAARISGPVLARRWTGVGFPARPPSSSDGLRWTSGGSELSYVDFRCLLRLFHN